MKKIIFVFFSLSVQLDIERNDKHIRVEEKSIVLSEKERIKNEEGGKFW